MKNIAILAIAGAACLVASCSQQQQQQQNHRSCSCSGCAGQKGSSLQQGLALQH